VAGAGLAASLSAARLARDGRGLAVAVVWSVMTSSWAVVVDNC
jgi:hypothetical protein